jgi:hypothetical protein
LDILSGLQVQIDSVWYNMLLSLAGLQWSMQRGFIMMGYTIELINQWLINEAFAPLIQQTNNSLSTAVSLVFVIALLILGLTYLLAAFIRLDVVNFRSAAMWYVAGLLFFTLGPSLYQGMNDFRSTVAQGFYLSTLNGLQGNVGGTFDSLNQVQTTDLGIAPLCDYLGVYLPGATGSNGIDGLDVALAYLRADGPDVMGFDYPVYSAGCPIHVNHPLTGAYISQVPQEWYRPDSYFDAAQSSAFFENLSPEERVASIEKASASQGRLLTAWPLILFGVVEQMIYLLITIAMGITFLSFSVAILFAFFKKTEVIAKSIIDQWIELIVQTIVIAIVQSLVVAFFLAGTASGNGVVVLGIGLICLVFMAIVLWSGVKAMWNSINRLFNALGQATGGVMLSPTQAAGNVASMATGGAGLAMSVGSNALAGMTALNRGGTVSQAAGITFGGSQTLSGAARTLAYLPGIRNTSLGETAEQFTEGSVTRTIARNVPVVGRFTGPMVGALMLTDRNPDNANYDERGRMLGRPMLVPAIGEGLERFTIPSGASASRQPMRDAQFIEGEDGEMLPITNYQPRRMGTFTPIEMDETDEDQRDYHAEMQGEEMEQHISDVMHSNTDNGSEQLTAQLQNAADMLMRAAQMQMRLGYLQVSGVPDVAGVMGDVVGQLQSEPSSMYGMHHLKVGDTMAQVMGVTPQDAQQPPIQRDLTRFGLFVDQALRMGLSPQHSEQVVNEVQSSPEGKLQPETRESLINQIQTNQNVSWNQANNDVNQLEHRAGMLPQTITAFGTMPVPQVTVEPEINVEPDIEVSVNTDSEDDYDKAMKDQSVMSGSGTVMGGE